MEVSDGIQPPPTFKDTTFETHPKVFLILNSILLSVTFLGGLILIYKLVKNRDKQPLLRKCSRLILLSVFGNWLFAMIIFFQ